MASKPTTFTALKSNNSFQAGTSGTTISAIISSLKSVSMGAVPNNGSASTTLTLTGAAVGAAVTVTPVSSLWSSTYLNLGLQGFVLTADTVTVSALNGSAATVTPANQNFRVTAINF